MSLPNDRDERLERLAYAYATGKDMREPCTTQQRDLFNGYVAGYRARDEDVAALVEALEFYELVQLNIDSTSPPEPGRTKNVYVAAEALARFRGES